MSASSNLSGIVEMNMVMGIVGCCPTPIKAPSDSRKSIKHVKALTLLPNILQTCLWDSRICADRVWRWIITSSRYRWTTAAMRVWHYHVIIKMSLMKGEKGTKYSWMISFTYLSAVCPPVLYVQPRAGFQIYASPYHHQAASEKDPSRNVTKS